MSDLNNPNTEHKFSILEDGSARMAKSSLGSEVNLGALSVGEWRLRIEEGNDFVELNSDYQYAKGIYNNKSQQGSSGEMHENWVNNKHSDTLSAALFKLKQIPSYCFPRRWLEYLDPAVYGEEKWVKENNDLYMSLYQAGWDKVGCLSIVPPYEGQLDHRYWFMIGGNAHLAKFWKPTYRPASNLENQDQEFSHNPLATGIGEREHRIIERIGLDFPRWKNYPSLHRCAQDIPEGMNVSTCKVNLPINIPPKQTEGWDAGFRCKFEQWEEIRFSFDQEQSVDYLKDGNKVDFNKRTGTIVIASTAPLRIRSSCNVYRRTDIAGSANSPSSWPSSSNKWDESTIDYSRVPFFGGFGDWREWHYAGDSFEEWYYVATISGLSDWFLYITSRDSSTDFEYSLQVEYVFTEPTLVGVSAPLFEGIT